jgi:hypothetical protein
VLTVRMLESFVHLELKVCEFEHYQLGADHGNQTSGYQARGEVCIMLVHMCI